jgi:hypothetical protein
VVETFKHRLLCDRLEASVAIVDETRHRFLEVLLTEALLLDKEHEPRAAE